MVAARRSEAQEEALLPWLLADVRHWCEGRSWLVRLPLLVYFAYGLFVHVASDQPYRSLFDGINLGIHELGHPLFAPLGDWMGAAGGTITQCLAPVASAVMFLRQRDYFAIAVCLCWLATNFWGVAIYAADARALELNLVAPGMGMVPASEGTISHDWEFMLGQLGWLQHDLLIAGFFRVAALLSMGVGLALGAWLLVEMARSPRDGG